MCVCLCELRKLCLVELCFEIFFHLNELNSFGSGSFCVERAYDIQPFSSLGVSEVSPVWSRCAWLVLELALACGRWNQSNVLTTGCQSGKEQEQDEKGASLTMVTCLPLSHKLWSHGCLVRIPSCVCGSVPMCVSRSDDLE